MHQRPSVGAGGRGLSHEVHAPPPPSPGGLSVRSWGAVLFALTFAEGALGVLSAGQASAAPTGLLVAHVAIGVGLVALSGLVLALAWRLPDRPARRATGFTAGALTCTAATGTIFLLTNFGEGAVIDRGLALLSLLGAVLMMAWGKESHVSIWRRGRSRGGLTMGRRVLGR